MRTIFMGSPEFAVASLEKVHELTDLQAVYTQPDKVRGRRGNKLEPTAVKRKALEFGLPVHEPKRIRDPEVIEDVVVFPKGGRTLWVQRTAPPPPPPPPPPAPPAP